MLERIKQVNNNKNIGGHTCSPSYREAKAGGSLGFTRQPSSSISNYQASERLSQKYKVDILWGISDLWVPGPEQDTCRFRKHHKRKLQHKELRQKMVAVIWSTVFWTWHGHSTQELTATRIDCSQWEQSTSHHGWRKDSLTIIDCWDKRVTFFNDIATSGKPPILQ